MQVERASGTGVANRFDRGRIPRSQIHAQLQEN